MGDKLKMKPINLIFADPPYNIGKKFLMFMINGLGWPKELLRWNGCS